MQDTCCLLCFTYNLAWEPLLPSHSANGVNTLASLQLQQCCSYSDALLTRRSFLQMGNGRKYTFCGSTLE